MRVKEKYRIYELILEEHHVRDSSILNIIHRVINETPGCKFFQDLNEKNILIQIEEYVSITNLADKLRYEANLF